MMNLNRYLTSNNEKFIGYHCDIVPSEVTIPNAFMYLAPSHILDDVRWGSFILINFLYDINDCETMQSIKVSFNYNIIYSFYFNSHIRDEKNCSEYDEGFTVYTCPDHNNLCIIHFSTNSKSQVYKDVIGMYTLKELQLEIKRFKYRYKDK